MIATLNNNKHASLRPIVMWLFMLSVMIGVGAENGHKCDCVRASSFVRN